MNLASRAVRGTAIILASSYVNMGFGVFYGIVMARLLDPTHFGVFALATFFTSLFDLRGKLGLDYAFIHRQPTTDQLIATHWLLQIGASGITLVLVIIASAFLPYLGYSSTIIALSIALAGAMMVEAAGTTARAALEKELVFARSTAIVTGSLFLSYLAAIALAMQGYTYWALVGQVAMNAAVSSLGFWWSYRQIGQRPSIRFGFEWAIARWMLRFGIVMSLGAIATTILLQFDNFLVGTFVSAAALGYYAQAYKVAQWPTGLVTHIVARASLPTYAKLQDDPARLSKAFEMSLWLILTTATPLALAIFVAAPDFLTLLYGQKWLPSAILLRFLIAYSVLRPLLDDTGALFTAIGRPQRITTVLAIQAVTLIIIATPLTVTFGAVGTAIGVGIAFAVGIGLTYLYITQTISLNVMRTFLPSIVATLCSIGLYMAIAQLIDLNAFSLLMRVAFKGSIAVGGFLAVMLLLERRLLLERAGYIWRLLRRGTA